MPVACIASAVLPSRNTAPGFTLIELILAVFLLSLLFGALLFNFTTLQPGSELAEGTDRFENLLRYARAQAAYCGRRVKVCFPPDDTNTFAENVYQVRLTWEPDPLERPGTYVNLPPNYWNLEAINQVVVVTQVSQPNTTPFPAQEAEPPSSLESESEEEVDSESTTLAELRQGEKDELMPITFFPDGSSDSAQIYLQSRSEEDPRKVKVLLSGVTGFVTHEWIDQSLPETDDAEDDWISRLLDEMAEAEPFP